MGWYEDLQELSIARQTRSDVVNYFRRLYPERTTKGGKLLRPWSKKLAEALQPFTRNKKGEPESIKNIQRRFQSRRGKPWELISPTKEAQEQYKRLGETLPRMSPPGGYRVHRGTILYIKWSQTCEATKVGSDFTITGKNAQELIETADPQIIVNVYMGLDYDSGDAPEACGDPELIVT
jgi:hypothetical protein